MTDEFWFSRPASFHKCFPSIASIEIEYSQTGDGVDDRDFPQHFTGEPPSHLHCLNDRCERGGVDLQGMIQLMVLGSEVERTFEQKCDGDEGSPKGRRKGDPCWNRFTIKIAIQYKSGATA